MNQDTDSDDVEMLQCRDCGELYVSTADVESCDECDGLLVSPAVAVNVPSTTSSPSPKRFLASHGLALLALALAGVSGGLLATVDPVTTVENADAVGFAFKPSPAFLVAPFPLVLATVALSVALRAADGSGRP